jgi:hypothetical protein
MNFEKNIRAGKRIALKAEKDNVLVTFQANPTASRHRHQQSH